MNYAGARKVLVYCDNPNTILVSNMSGVESFNVSGTLAISEFHILEEIVEFAILI